MSGPTPTPLQQFNVRSTVPLIAEILSDLKREHEALFYLALPNTVTLQYSMFPTGDSS